MQTAEGEVFRFDHGERRDSAGALATVVRRLSTARSLEEVMGVVTYGVRTLLHADGATFVLRDGDRCHYAEEDAISPLWKGRRFPIEICISGWCMLHRAPTVVGDIYADPRIPIDAYRPTFVRSLAMAPVGSDEPIAALGAYWSFKREIAPQELQLLQTIANAAALALAALQRWSPVPSPPPQGTSPAHVERKRRSPPRRGALWTWVARLRREGLRPNSVEAYAFAVLSILIATIVREVVKASGAQGLTLFATFYPAVLLSMLVAGKRSGILAAALGGLAGYYFFMPPLYEFVRLDKSDALNLMLYGGACALIILIIDWYQRSLLRLKEADAKHFTLASEQRHRVKNALFVVEAVVRQSLKHEPEVARLITERIRAGLADVDIHGVGSNEAIGIRQLLTTALEPYDLGRFTLAGEETTLRAPEVRRLLILATHELATNALKHGALSGPQGRVNVSWRTDDGRATVSWRESGGPPVKPPQRRGYGSILLSRLVEASKGSLNLDFRASGLAAEISLPLEAA
jgi:two-component sensor histidine kinase